MYGKYQYIVLQATANWIWKHVFWYNCFNCRGWSI